MSSCMLFTHFNDIKRHKGEGISNISTECMCLIYLVFNVAEPVGRKPSSGHNYTVVEYFRYISNACSYVTMQPFVIPRKLITFNACILSPISLPDRNVIKHRDSEHH